MTNDRRRSSLAPPVPAAAGLLALLLLLVAPPAAGQAAGAPTLTLDPPQAEPGEHVTATLHIPTLLADVGVQDRVRCVVASGEDAIEACDWAGALVDVRVAPDGVDYVIVVVAPPDAGSYDVTLTRTPFAAQPIGQVSATATLAVAPAPEPLDPGSTNATDPAAPATDGGARTTRWTIWNIFTGAPDDPTDPDAPEDDAARWLVSTTSGTATLLIVLFAIRGPGGRP